MDKLEHYLQDKKNKPGAKVIIRMVVAAYSGVTSTDTSKMFAAPRGKSDASSGLGKNNSTIITCSRAGGSPDVEDEEFAETLVSLDLGKIYPVPDLNLHITTQPH